MPFVTSLPGSPARAPGNSRLVALADGAAHAATMPVNR